MAKKTFKIKHPGALKRRAAREGRTVAAQATHDLHAPGAAGAQARLYHNVFAPATKKRHRVAVR